MEGGRLLQRAKAQPPISQEAPGNSWPVPKKSGRPAASLGCRVRAGFTSIRSPPHKGAGPEPG